MGALRKAPCGRRRPDSFAPTSRGRPLGPGAALMGCSPRTFRREWAWSGWRTL